MTNRMMVVIVLLSGQLLLTGCVSFAETPGERFRKAIKEIEAACAKRKLDPNEVCGGVAKLKPADPLATEEGRFAHSIKIPNPVPEDSGYKPGMTPEQYFDHLCKTEGGEFIYKTVERKNGDRLLIRSFTGPASCPRGMRGMEPNGGTEERRRDATGK